jgi:hypothetical protein
VLAQKQTSLVMLINAQHYKESVPKGEGQFAVVLVSGCMAYFAGLINQVLQSLY